MNGTPPDPDFADDIDDRYRRATALDPSRPSEAVRSAVLEHAANLLEQRAGNADENVGANVGAMRPAQIRRWRRPAIFGTLAAAALAGLLITPRFLPPREDSQKKAAESPAPRTAAPRTPVSELPRDEQEPPTFVADEMASPASPPAPAAAPTSSPSASPSASPSPAPAASASPALRGLEASLAKQDAFVGDVTPRAAAAAQSAATTGRAGGGVATNAPSARAQNLASTRSMFAASAPTEAQTRSITVTAARRADTAAALRQAAEAGDMDALQTLLSGHTDSEPPSQIDARDSSGRTALMLATLHGRQPAVEALLVAGADPNAADAHGTTPLQAAIAGGQPDIIAALQHAGAR